MSQPVPEETNEALDLTEEPPGEHKSSMSKGGDGDQVVQAEQERNAESSEDQPSQ